MLTEIWEIEINIIVLTILITLIFVNIIPNIFVKLDKKLKCVKIKGLLSMS
jgi:hypothetical protein